MEPQESMPGRRPLKTRSTLWASTLSQALIQRNVSPNQISLASIGAAALACVFFALVPVTTFGPIACSLFVLGAVFIQLRLLCNLLDGMVAVEGGKRSPLGELFNDVPDRVSDVLILVGAGVAVRGEHLVGFSGYTWGWIAAAVAVTSAYIRLLGVSLGTPHYFIGPMAKPHRMALLTVAALIAAFLSRTEAGAAHGRVVLITSLALIAVGGALTCARRLRLIANHLIAASSPATGAVDA